MATIFPNPKFNAETGAQAMRDALHGKTGEAAIIDILVKHSMQQRLDIASKYKTMFGKDLVKDLKAELGGNFEDAVVALMTPRYIYLAKELKRAMKGIGTDTSVLTEICCGYMPHDLEQIRSAYKEETGKDLEADISSDTSGHLKKLLISQVNAARDPEDMPVDHNKADADARKLYEAGEKKWGTDEATFLMILASRSYNQLYATFERYKELYGIEIEDSITKETSGAFRDGLLGIAIYTRDPSVLYAKKLYESMKGLGTDDRTLIRIVVTRAEDDLAPIANVFYLNYEKSLADFIAGDCSGDYKRLLLAIVGNN